MTKVLITVTLLDLRFKSKYLKVIDMENKQLHFDK